MTTVQITLPDQLVQEATNAGLLEPDVLERMLRARPKADRIDRLGAARTLLAEDPPPAMTADEINAEIERYRTEQRSAART